MFDRIKKLFKSSDRKPTTVSFVLGRDDCSRLLIQFSENDLETSEKIMILKIAQDGSVYVFSSQNMSGIECLGLLSIAQGMVSSED